MTRKPIDALTSDLLALVRHHDPEWTNVNESDPGATLLEVSAWLTQRIGAQRPDPYRNFKFRVKWDGTVVAGVSHISALRRTNDIVEYRSGSGPEEVQRLPGKVVWEPFTLERPLGPDTGFEDWAAAVGQGGTASWRKNVRIEILDDAGQLFLAYDVYDCWPTGYRILPTLTESLTLLAEGWHRDKSVEPVA